MWVLIRMQRRHSTRKRLDEAHAAHVGRQVVDLHRAFHRPPAVFVFAQIQAQALDARHALVPLGQRLLVHRADAGETLLVEIARERRRR